MNVNFLTFSAHLQAGDVEEEQLVKSCGQLRQVESLLEIGVSALLVFVHIQH